jgi:hypothetical protein
MKHLALSIVLLALGFTAASPARADFAVIRWADGRCSIVPAIFWGYGWPKIAITPDWWSAQIARDWAITNGTCIL